MSFLSNLFSRSSNADLSSKPAPPKPSPDAPIDSSVSTSVSTSDSQPQQTQQQQSQPPQPTNEAKVTPNPNDNNSSGELDLVFIMDSTGSMAPYITAAQDNIINIVERIVASEKADVQFGLVAYRDHPPQDSTYVTKVFDFTSSHKTMLSNVKSLSAQGGGDGPEAVTAALDAVLKLPFRKNSVKICVFIADAPPHGLGEPGDGFPKGDPEGRDPLKIARQLLERGVTIYSVACEPALSGYKYAVDFFDAIAKITTGKFLPLTSAKLLADVIIGGAQEEMDLDKLKADLEKEVENIKKTEKKQLTEDELSERVAQAWAAKGITSREVEVDDVYVGRHTSNMALMESAESMEALRGKLAPQTYHANMVQESHNSSKPMHKEKVSRLMKKAFK